MFKYIFAVLLFFLLKRSILGAIVGFFIGSYIDNLTANDSDKKSSNTSNPLFDFYTQRSSTGDFATMLMALSAAVMRADDRHLKSELEFVKSFYIKQFGPQFLGHHLQTLKHFIESGNIPLEEICYDINHKTTIDIRIQLMHYLFGIANADGQVAESELHVLKQISILLNIQNTDFDTLKNMFYRSVDSDYVILGITPAATETDIKKAYRQMAIRYHPDKVAQMGESYQHGAKEKFQKIQEAYENIKKQRGIN